MGSSQLLGSAPRARRVSVAWLGTLALPFTLVGCRGAEVESPRSVEGGQAHPEVTLPPPAPWIPAPDEVLPEVKRLAAEVASDMTTDPSGSSPSAGRVIYPQLVGFAEGRAAVTVLVEQTFLHPDGGGQEFRRVLDLRLRHSSDGWVLEGHGSGEAFPAGRPTPRTLDSPGPSAAGQRVLEHPNVHLPHDAEADVREGRVSEELLELLGAIGDRHEIHVMTLVSQRPTRVFGTERLSHHAVGRAVDIHSVDGVPVISQREAGSPAHRLVLWLFEQGGVHIGSPWALDGFGGRSFTDLVHQDHLHVAVPP